MGQKLDVSTRGMKLPFTLGHEIAGEVAAMVGLFGGDSPLSLASMPLRMLTIEGSYVGNLEELH